MSNITELNEENFKEKVVESNKLTVVDFWATWCGPCRKLGPVLDEIADEMPEEINIYKVNADENMKIAKEYSVSGLPSLLIFKDGQPVERLVGLMPKTNIINNIKKHL